ncbi:hypothetical protein ACFSTC_21605 [Nonomuraea ferruginea]
MPIAISWNAHRSRCWEVNAGSDSSASRFASSGVLPLFSARSRAERRKEARFLAFSVSTVW